MLFFTKKSPVEISLQSFFLLMKHENRPAVSQIHQLIVVSVILVSINCEGLNNIIILILKFRTSAYFSITNC